MIQSPLNHCYSWCCNCSCAAFPIPVTEYSSQPRTVSVLLLQIQSTEIPLLQARAVPTRSCPLNRAWICLLGKRTCCVLWFLGQQHWRFKRSSDQFTGDLCEVREKATTVYVTCSALDSLLSLLTFIQIIWCRSCTTAIYQLASIHLLPNLGESLWHQWCHLAQAPAQTPDQDKAGTEQHLKQTLLTYSSSTVKKNGGCSGTCEHKPITLHGAVPAPWNLLLRISMN